MRDYKHLDSYLNQLAGDIYIQPEDSGHTALAQRVIDHWMSRLTACRSVLDLGCGTGFCQPMFEKWGIEYEGICLGEDYMVAKEKGRNVKRMDFSFLEYPDSSFDILFARHSWEHSPMPLVTLMEWRRVSRQWLGLILPAPHHYTVRGRNHYNVLYREQALWLLEVAGWNPIWDETIHVDDNAESKVPLEYWLFCERIK